MSKITSIYDFTNYWREKFPSLYKDKNDEEVINLVRESYPKLKVPTYQEALETNQDQPVETDTKNSESLSNQNIEPHWVDNFFLTADFIPEKWQQEGVMGVSSDFFRQAYNNSMAGQLYQTVHGEKKWTENPGYDPSWYAQAGQFAVGMLSPLDAATMIGTGALGKVAAGTARAGIFGRGVGAKYLEKGILSNFATKYPKIGAGAMNTIDGALSLGIGGGTFAATHALVHDTARQRRENPDGKVNVRDALKVASDEFLHSAPMFAIAGGVTQGIMGSLHGYSQAYMKGEGFAGKYAKKITEAATSPLSRVGTEAALFTSLPSAMGDEDAPKFNSPEWWAGLGTNALIVGGMRAVGSFAENKYFDANKFISTEMKLATAKNKPLKDAAKSINDNLGPEAPKETRDLVKKLIVEESSLNVDLQTLNKDIKFVQKMNRNLQDPEYLAKTKIEGSKENIEFGKWANISNEYQTGTRGMVESILSDKGKMQEFYKKYYGKEPTPQDLIKLEKNLKQWSETMFKDREWVEDYLAGNWRQSNDGVNGGEPGPLRKAPIRTDVEGTTRQVALKDWSNKEIIKRAKEAGFEEGVEFKLDNGKVVNKEKIINRIFDKKKAIELKKLEELKATGQEAREELTIIKEEIQLLTGKITPADVELAVIKNKTLSRTDIKPMSKVRESAISDVHKNFLAYTMANHKKGRMTQKGSAATKETIGLFEHIERVYNKDINKLNTNQKAKLAKDYIHEKLGVDLYDLKPQEKLNKYTERQIRALERKADIIRDNLAEFFTQGELKNIVGELTSTIGKFNVKGARKVAIVGGDKGFAKWINFVKNKKKIDYTTGKSISAKEAELAIKLAVAGKVRPGELSNITVNKVNPKTGEIAILRQKGEPPTYITNKKLAQELYSFAQNKKRKGTDKLFSFKDAKDVNAFAEYLAKNSGTDVRVEHRITGKDYAWNEIIPGEARIGNIEIPSKKAGTGLQYGRAFRSLFEGEGIDIKAAASARGHTTPKTTPQYKTKTIKQKRAERLPEEQVFQTKADKAARDKFIANVMRKNKLSKEQLKREGLTEGVLGEFGEGVVKLQKGLWQPADFYHENLHILKAFARASNNKSLTKLIERGEKLAVGTKEYKAWKKKNVNRDVEEFLADIVGGKASRMEFSKGMMDKIGQFVKQLVSRVKVALGGGNFNDISRVLSKRVQKGFSTKGVEFVKGDIKYKMEGMTPDAALKFSKKTLRELFKKDELSASNEKRLIGYVGEIANLGKEFKLNKETSLPALEQFVSTINTMDKALLKRLPDKLEWWSSFRDAEKVRLVKNVTEKQREVLLKDLFVEDGLIYKASNQQLKDFIEIVNTMDDVQKSTTSWIDERVAEGKLNKDVAERFKAVSNVKFGMPVATVLESVGLKKLAQKLYNHTSSELKYIGDFDKFEYKMESMLGSRKWNQTKDMTYLFDKQRYFERLEKGLLKGSEKRFINEALNTETWKPKNTKEGMIVKEHIKLMKNYKDALVGKDGVLRQVLNEAEFEKFMADKNINWINESNNVYVQRRLTQEFKKYYQPTENHFKDLIAEQTEYIANKLAKDFYKGKKVSKEKLREKSRELYDDANAIAHGELYELFEFNPGKYSPSFLKERHTKLPEFVKLDGKNVQVYETKFGLTTKDYAINQAKFLANVEYFPEFVKLKGFNKPGAKELLGQLKVKDSALATWVDRRLKDHLKIDKQLRDYPDGIRLVRHTTALMAKFQLSFPTSGIKNFFVGSSQSLLAYRLRDFLGGFADAIHRDNRKMVRATGATEIGMRHFEMGGMGKYFDKIAEKGFFRFGLMKPTENLNRYVSVLAGKRDQLHLARRLQFNKEGTKSYERAVNKLKSFYKLSDADVALLKKFGMNGVKGFDGKTAGLNKRALDKLYQKMNTYAHINTQGAAINLFMPDWAAGELAQSALLYKRMAYAATVNTTRNMKIALQNKSMLQPIMFGLGAYFSGEALLTFYDKVLGQPPPKENSGQWNAIKTALWKGEFLGILTEVLSPFDEYFVGQTMYPSVLSTASNMWSSVAAVAKGERFIGQGVNDFMKGTAGLYNNTRKLYQKGLLAKDSYASGTKKYGKFYRDMLEEYGERDELSQNNKTEVNIQRSKYQVAFRELFESGYSKDLGGNSLGKWYMMCVFAKANELYYTGISENGNAIKTEQEAFKAALKSMENVVRSMHPNKTAITAKTKRGIINQAKRADQFMQWLNKDGNRSDALKKLTDQYEYRKRVTLAKSIKEYLKEANLKNDLKYYNIKIADILLK